MASFYEIECYNTINNVDADKVTILADSMKNNGWHGMPILFVEGQLITGSHRFAALHQIYDHDMDGSYISLLSNSNIALDVSEEVEAYCEDNDCTLDDLPYDNLRLIFTGTDIEKYKNEIEEW